ncbi:uncharacterized protein M8220_007709 [Acridotheres tristis]
MLTPRTLEAPACSLSPPHTRTPALPPALPLPTPSLTSFFSGKEQWNSVQGGFLRRAAPGSPFPVPPTRGAPARRSLWNERGWSTCGREGPGPVPPRLLLQHLQLIPAGEGGVATLREKIHHLDDMLKSQQRKVRHMIEQLQNSKSVIQKKQAELQELQERVSYLEAENLEMHDRTEHLIEAQASPGGGARASKRLQGPKLLPLI